MPHTHPNVKELFEQRFVNFHARWPGNDDWRAFETLTLQEVAGIDQDEAFEQSDLKGGTGGNGGDRGLDGFHWSPEDRTLILTQCKWHETPADSSDDSASKDLQKAVISLFGSGEDGGASSEPEKFAQLKRVIENARDSDPEGPPIDVTLCIATNGDFGPEAIRVLKELQSHVNAQPGLRATSLVANSQYFEECKVRAQPTNEDLQSTVVSFTLAPSTRPIEMTPLLPDDMSGCAVSISGTDVADAVKRYGAKIFSKNIRYGFAEQTKIKGAIKATAKEKPESFWVMNNGMTILADGFKISPSRIEIENPQIVNGCQTASTLEWQHRQQDGPLPSGIFILARVVVPGQGDTHWGNEISVASNTQEKVIPQDLKSNRKELRTLQARCSQTKPPIYLSRKRNEFQSLPQAERAKYANRGQNLLPDCFKSMQHLHVTSDEAGHAQRAISEPAASISKKKLLYDDDDTFMKVFDPTLGGEQFLLPHFLRIWIQSQTATILDEWQRDQPELGKQFISARKQVEAHLLYALWREGMGIREDPSNEEKIASAKAWWKVVVDPNSSYHDETSDFAKSLRKWIRSASKSQLRSASQETTAQRYTSIKKYFESNGSTIQREMHGDLLDELRDSLAAAPSVQSALHSGQL